MGAFHSQQGQRLSWGRRIESGRGHCRVHGQVQDRDPRPRRGSDLAYPRTLAERRHDSRVRTRYLCLVQAIRCPQPLCGGFAGSEFFLENNILKCHWNVMIKLLKNYQKTKK